MTPGLLLLGGPHRAALAAVLRERHGAYLLAVRPRRDRGPLERFAYLTACLRLTMRRPDPLVAWDHNLDELLADLPGAALVALRRPVSRVLNRLGAVCVQLHDPHLAADGHSLRQLAASLAEKVEANRAGQLPAALDPAVLNVAGHLGDATVLVVGDRVNPRRPHPGWPFYGLGASSEFLGAALHRCGVPEYLLFWVNVNDAGGVELVRAALAAKRPAFDDVLVLGAEAAVTWRRAGLEAALPPASTGPTYLNHPAWYRRFHAHDHLLDGHLRTALAGLQPPVAAGRGA